MMKILIPDPCNQNWNEMQPASDGRFCKACAKNVVDFTGFTDAQLASYFKSNPKNVCGKLSSGQLDRNLAISSATALYKAASPSKFYSIRQSPLYIGLGFSLLNITSCIPSTGKHALDEVEITETRKANPSSTSENRRTSEKSQLNDPELKDKKSEDLQPGEAIPGETKSKDHELNGIELRSKGDFNKTPVGKPGDHLLISPVIGKPDEDLLPARISSYLTNSSQMVDTIITGIVKDTGGLPIAGATIVIYGSPIGTVTNTEGRFSLTVPPEQINDQIKLSILYTGYNEKLLSVQGSYSKDLNISLVPVENVLLGEVVFTGGICVKPTKWQRIKNLVTFWKAGCRRNEYDLKLSIGFS